jgi:hypothetical protein
MLVFMLFGFMAMFMEKLSAEHKVLKQTDERDFAES